MNCKQFILLLAVIFSTVLRAQNSTNVLPENATLQQCIDFALENRPNIKIATIDEAIAEKEIASSLSGWFPQLNLSSNYIHNLKIPSAIIGDQVIYMGKKNTSAVTFQADQQILNPQLMQAAKSAKLTRMLNAQNTVNNKINTVVEVSKAYYGILTSNEQLQIITANILRNEKQLSDAKDRYDVGLVDQTDFKRAQIALNNSKADLKRTNELLKYKYSYLKELLGLKQDVVMSLALTEADMESQVILETGESVQAENRVEYKMLEIQKGLQTINTKFGKAAFMPQLSAYLNYGWDWRDAKIENLYNSSVPRSVLGINFNFNIFDGIKKISNIRSSQFMEKRIDVGMVQLKNQINSEYQLALATYNSGINDWKVAKENMQMSKDVYDIIKLQYDEGLKTYLDLMNADTDLKAAQVNYLNALYAVLSSKLDVQKAMGTITISSQK